MKKSLVVALSCLISMGAYAEKAFQASLIPDVAIESSDTFIKGVSLSIWGENPQKSLALGVVNGFTGDSSGLALGWLLNYADNYKGAQIAFVNYNKGSFTGLQYGAVNYAGQLKGLQLGFLNYAETADTGVQLGFINLMGQTEEWFTGFPDEVAPGMIFVNWRFK